MKIVVETSNATTIDIQLFNQPAIKKWFDYFKNTNQEYFMCFSNPIAINNLNDHEIQKHWDIILTTINKLKTIGLVYDTPLPLIFNKDQQTLNNLHRFFTYNDKWGIDYIDAQYLRNPLPKNSFSPAFTMPENLSFDDWHSIIEKINSAVHTLEQSTITATKSFINNNLPLLNCLIHQRKSNFWVEFTAEEQQLNYTYFNYDLPLITLNKSILGKCPLQSFYEEDDLNADDCTGRIGSFGGFEFDLTGNRKKIYQSSQFEKWVNKHNRTIESVPVEFTIGYVSNFDEVNTWLTKNVSLAQVLFID